MRNPLNFYIYTGVLKIVINLVNSIYLNIDRQHTWKTGRKYKICIGRKKSGHGVVVLYLLSFGAEPPRRVGSVGCLTSVSVLLLSISIKFVTKYL